MTRRNTNPKQKAKAIVLERSDGACERCGCGRATEIHHRLPRRMGGTRRPEVNEPSNLLHLCAECHRWIETNRREAEADGLLLKDRQDPTDVKVLLWNGRLRLDNAGGWTNYGFDDVPDEHKLACSFWESEKCDCGMES